MENNYIELTEEKVEKTILTHLKLNGKEIYKILDYKIEKNSIYDMELTLKISINPEKSYIKL